MYKSCKSFIQTGFLTLSDDQLRGVQIMEKQLRLFMALIMIMALVPWGAMGAWMEASIPVPAPGLTTIGNESINQSIRSAFDEGYIGVNITVTQSGYQVNLTSDWDDAKIVDTMGVNVTIRHIGGDNVAITVLMNSSLKMNGTTGNFGTWFYSPAQLTLTQGPSTIDTAKLNNASLIQLFGTNASVISGGLLTIQGRGLGETIINHTKWADKSNITARITATGNNMRIVDLWGKNSNITLLDGSATLATKGIVNLTATAENNLIMLPQASFGSNKTNIFNLTHVRDSSAWYFYNNSQTDQTGNMHLNISPRGFPIIGEGVGFSIYHHAMNESVATGHYWHNNTGFLNWDDNGKGYAFMSNRTDDLIFKATADNPAMQLPVNISLMNDNQLFKWTAPGIGEYNYTINWDPVYAINFDPMMSIPTGPAGPGAADFGWNRTFTTNWTKGISNFKDAKVTFAVNRTTNANLIGNLTIEGVDLTNEATARAIAQLGQSIDINATAIKLDTTGLTALNKPATLYIFPEFAFSAGAASVNRISDTGASFQLVSAGQQSYLFSTYATAFEINENAGYMKLGAKGFSTYWFGNSAIPPAPEPQHPDASKSSDSGISTSGPVTAATGTTLTYTGLPISAITFQTDVDLKSTIILVERVRMLPGNIQPPSQQVYQFVEITPVSGTAGHIKEGAKISFSVPVGYLSAMGMTTHDVALLRNVNGVWTQLPTRLVKIEGGMAYYEATTPGFSTFAIALQKDGAREVAPVATPTPKPEVVVGIEEEEVVAPVPATPMPVADATPAPAAPAAPADEPAPFPMTFVIIGIVIILLIIGGAYYFTKKEDKK